MALICQNDQRRNTVRAGCYNGIDYAELLLDDQGTVRLDEQGEPFTLDYLRIAGGRRVTNLRVVGLRFIRARDSERDDYAELLLNQLSDQSPYTLRLLADASGGLAPLTDYDPRYTSVSFSFTPSGPVDVDCATLASCPETTLTTPELSYLAKDYASFRHTHHR